MRLFATDVVQPTARPVQIDRDKALRAARDIFWPQGFTATSMSQLLKVMDIGSGSFYSAFGSKPELFAQVIEKYDAWSAAQWGRIRSSRQGLDAISEFLNTTVVDVSDKKRRKGCLLVNSILEMEGVDTEQHQQLVDRFKGLEHRLSICLQEAQDSGTLREDVSIAEGGVSHDQYLRAQGCKPCGLEQGRGPPARAGTYQNDFKTEYRGVNNAGAGRKL